MTPARLGQAAWLLLGLCIVVWLWRLQASNPLWISLALLLPWGVNLPALLLAARNAYGYAMLLSIIYTVFAAMELISLPRSPVATAALLAASLASFLLLIPAVRWQRRLENREQMAASTDAL